jgi:hypothetical protein
MIVVALDELTNHAGAVQRCMPGLTLELRGTVRRAHDLALADWAAVAPDGTATLAGTNIFRFAADGRIAEVAGVPSRSWRSALRWFGKSITAPASATR